MSVPVDTLTDDYRTDLLDFYGRMLGWHEMNSLRRPDRLTIAVGGSTYINIREQPESMTTHGYEYFGVLVRTPSELRRLWDVLAKDSNELQLEPLSTNPDGEGSFRFQFLLPMAIEAQFYASLH